MKRILFFIHLSLGVLSTPGIASAQMTETVKEAFRSVFEDTPWKEELRAFIGSESPADQPGLVRQLRRQCQELQSFLEASTGLPASAIRCDIYLEWPEGSYLSVDSTGPDIPLHIEEAFRGSFTCKPAAYWKSLPSAIYRRYEKLMDKPVALILELSYGPLD